MGFTLQDIISNALRDAKSGASFVGNSANTLDKNLKFIAQQNVPVGSGVAATVEDTINPPQYNPKTDKLDYAYPGQEKVHQAAQDALTNLDPRQAPAGIGAGIDLATTLSRPAAIKASAVTKQAIQNVLKAHQDVQSAYHASGLADQSGFVKIPGAADEPIATDPVRSPGQLMLPSMPTPKFEGFKDYSSKVLDKLEGLTTAKPARIQGIINETAAKEGLNSREKEILQNTLKMYPGDEPIPVEEFAGKARDQFMPIERHTQVDTPHSSTNIPENERQYGDYAEHVYTTPYDTQDLGTTNHYHNPYYFGHTRTEHVESGIPADTTGWNVVPHKDEYGRMPDTYDVVDGNGNVVANRYSPESAQSFIENGSTKKEKNVLEVQQDIAQKDRNNIKEFLPSEENTKEYLGRLEHNQKHHTERIENLNTTSAALDELEKIGYRYGTPPDEQPKNVIDTMRKAIQKETGNVAYEHADPRDVLRTYLDKIHDVSSDNAYEVAWANSKDELKNTFSNYAERSKQQLDEIAGKMQQAKDTLASFAKGNTPEISKDYLPYTQGGNGWKYMLRHEIQDSIDKGDAAIKFPTGDTIAKIESEYWLPDHYKSFENGMGAESGLESGDTFEDPYSGEDHTVLRVNGDDSYESAPSDNVETYNHEDALKEERDQWISEQLAPDPSHYSESIIEYFHHYMNNYPERIQKQILALDKKTNFMQDPSWYRDKSGDYISQPAPNPKLIEHFNKTIHKINDETGNKVFEDLAHESSSEYNTPQDWADYWESALGYPHYAEMNNSGDYTGRIHTVPEGEVGTVEAGPREWPDDIRSEIGDGEKGIYDRYNEDFPAYIKKLGYEIEHHTDDYGNTWHRIDLTKHQEKKGKPVHMFQYLPPIVGAGAISAAANQQQSPGRPLPAITQQ